MKEYTFNEIKVGIKERFAVIVSEKMMAEFCALSGDTNPLHTSSNYAQSQNFKDRVVYGLLTSSFYSTLVGVHLPGLHSLLQKINIQFNKPVFIGDQLSIMGEVSHTNEALKIIEIKAKILNQEGVKVSSAKIIVGLFK